MTGQLAVITAVLATIGAIFSYMGGATQADAALAKNDAAIRKTEASDQWNFYQAKNARQAIAEVALDIVPAERRDTYAKNIEKYKADKEPIMAKAKELEEQAKEFDEQSEHLMHQHHRWAEATTAIQVVDRAGRDRAADAPPLARMGHAGRGRRGHRDRHRGLPEGVTTMKVCIYGAGAIGLLVGARLAATGSHQVSAVARGATLAALERARAARGRLRRPDLGAGDRQRGAVGARRAGRRRDRGEGAGAGRRRAPHRAAAGPATR